MPKTVRDDSPITLTEAAKLPELSRNGRKPHLATLYRWAGMGGNGIRGVILRTWLIGGRRCTSAAAVREFLRAISGGHESAPPMSAAQRSRELDRLERDLAAAGI